LITRRDEPSSKLLRVPFAGLQPVPRPQLGCDPPAPKDDSTLRSRTLLSSCLRGNAGSRCGNLTPGPSRRGPPGLFVDRSYVPCAGHATAPALAVRSRLGPNVDGVAGRIQEVSYYHRVTPCGLSNVHEGHPVRGGVASATVANVGSVHSGDEDRWFPESGLCSHRSVHGACDPVLHA